MQTFEKNLDHLRTEAWLKALDTRFAERDSLTKARSLGVYAQNYLGTSNAESPKLHKLVVSVHYVH
jgi:hypothetical protein